MSEAEVMKPATNDFLDIYANKREAMAVATAQADKGVFISLEAMLDWMERLDANPDATPPEPDVFLPPRT